MPKLQAKKFARYFSMSAIIAAIFGGGAATCTPNNPTSVHVIILYCVSMVFVLYCYFGMWARIQELKCVSLCVCKHACVCISVCVPACMCVYFCVCARLHVCVFLCVCKPECVCISVCVQAWMRVYLCVCASLPVCLRERERERERGRKR